MSHWFLLSALLALCVLLVSLVLGWWVVWRLVLSKFPFFQELIGSKEGSAKWAKLAAQKKKRQQEANSFVLTRAGEQTARRRESRLQAAAAQAAALAAAQEAQQTQTQTPQAQAASDSPAFSSFATVTPHGQ